MAKKTRVHGHGTRHAQIPFNYCFACGKDNPDGMHLKFHYEARRKRFVCRFRLGRKYTGPPAHAHGGVIATILDEAMGKVNKLRNVIAMTSQMKVEYLKPVFAGATLQIHTRIVTMRMVSSERETLVQAEDGTLHARALSVWAFIDFASPGWNISRLDPSGDQSQMLKQPFSVSG